MQNADHILAAIRKLGEKRLPLTRVYRCLFSEDLFLLAYSKLARNQGALTPGTANDTADGMSRQRIRTIIQQLRNERFRPRPARRIHIPKRNGGTRPLGIPNFSEKLVQEVLRMILTAYYEPRFRTSSHGFRPGRGCHTALEDLKRSFGGTKWFIEGDIRGAFDNLDHSILMSILARDIKDGRLLNLIQQHLHAGVVEEWRYQATYSGTPQGGVLSPLLSNIYFHTLDEFIEDVLIPEYTRGKRRRENLAYKRLEYAINRAHKQGDRATAEALKRKRSTIPSCDMHDPGFRRLFYLRYADDFILGFSGPKSEALEIKEKLGAFLRNELKVELHSEKTFITHATTEHAQFLGYAVSIYHVDDKMSRRNGVGTRTRSINGRVRLGIPTGLMDKLAKPYYDHGKIVSVPQMLQNSVPSIFFAFQSRYRGIVEYYKYAVDRKYFSKLKYVMETALVKTLAQKLRISVNQVYHKYRSTKVTNGRVYKVLRTIVETETGQHQFWWGAVPLTVVKVDYTAINDSRHVYEAPQYFEQRTDVVARLQANRCEVCGSTDECEVHHIRKLADLKRRWAGRKDKPLWVGKMIALSRRTLVVCHRCHRTIHNGEALPGRDR